MIKTALKNPIAVLMGCVALMVFAAVVTPRLSVDTFPELTPPVLVVGTQAPGMGPKDVEKTITWRFEKYIASTPGVDTVKSVSRAGLSVIYVWLKWGTDLNAAQSLVQQQVQFAVSSIPKSLGVVPPFVLQYDPTNAPVIQVAVYGGGLTEPQLYDYAANVIEPILEGIPGVASASPNGGRERQINVVVAPARAQALGVTPPRCRRRWRAGCRRRSCKPSSSSRWSSCSSSRAGAPSSSPASRCRSRSPGSAASAAVAAHAPARATRRRSRAPRAAAWARSPPGRRRSPRWSAPHRCSGSRWPPSPTVFSDP